MQPSTITRWTRIVLMFVILIGLLCLPVIGAPISLGISTGPPESSQLSAAAYEKQGMAQMDHRDWNGLITTTNEGLLLYPQDAVLYGLRGYALRKVGNFAGSVDNVTHAIALDPKPVQYANRGFGYLALGDNIDAINDANTAIALNKSYTPSYGVKAIALINTGNLTGAEQTIDSVIPLDPANPFFWQLKGRVLAGSGNCTGAAETFRYSIQIDPDYNLPWPGFGNATTDLQKAETQCAAPVKTPVPTQASVPAVLAGAALVLAVLARER
ncbi:MAG: tetratricopeptide repeat protein [Methanoregula sp.]|nr:tetratricopeptide repeat protein [Methanoregula sp.]